MRGRHWGTAVGLTALAMSTLTACGRPGWPPHGPGGPGGPGGGQVQTVEFDEPGAHTWTVPAGVRYATFDVHAAAGGGVDPGQGAHVRATIPVTPGETVTLVVGGEGGDPSGQTAGAGGSGGGAPGGTGGDPFVIPTEYPVPSLPGGVGGGGGGGASDVRSGPADDTGLATRIIVAGGGGGAAGVAGGDGGLDGLAGADGSVVYNYPEAFPPVVVPGGVPGAGTVGHGAAGADGPNATLEIVVNRPVGTYEGDAGGGGGGGLVGGGGGLSATSGGGGMVSFDGTASGGAGGSSLVPADDLCPTVVEDGARAGSGQIVVTFRRGAAPSRACL